MFYIHTTVKENEIDSDNEEKWKKTESRPFIIGFGIKYIYILKCGGRARPMWKTKNKPTDRPTDKREKKKKWLWVLGMLVIADEVDTYIEKQIIILKPIRSLRVWYSESEAWIPHVYCRGSIKHKNALVLHRLCRER